MQNEKSAVQTVMTKDSIPDESDSVIISDLEKLLDSQKHKCKACDKIFDAQSELEAHECRHNNETEKKARAMQLQVL